jgi:NAD(P)H-hydrate epimerase
MARQITARTAMPLVLDADGITALAGHDDLLRNRERLCLTPHPGELSRLIGVPAAAIAADPMEYARKTAGSLRAVVLLKGAATVIAGPDGRMAVNATGNAGMATGGSGDVLTGVIAGLIAQGAGIFEAAVMGAWLHGKAGDLAAAELGPRSMTASDLLRCLPGAFMSLKGEGVR